MMAPLSRHSGLLEGGLVAEDLWVEDYKVGIGTDLQAPLLAGFGRASFQAQARVGGSRAARA